MPKSTVMAVTRFALLFRWFLRVLGGSPLGRVSDRLEALSAVVVTVLVLFAVPLAALVKTEVYSAGARTADEQAQTRHAVEAQALESTAALADFDNPGYVRVRWQGGGQFHEDTVIAPAPVEAGDAVRIWVDDAGKVVPAPVTVTDAEMAAVGAAVAVWLAVVGSCALATWVVRRGLDRARDHAWERELRLHVHNDDGRANRHT
ncbi:Rv1733c family protein [Mycobacterium sp. SMC-4]|uniref:Rv1733c family protein n=1 Tax=Mycobacterium sp. SMC-4 TaxID=2857059 RepID=UPI003CFE6CAF